MSPTLTYERYYQLVTDSALLHSLKAEQLPELNLAITLCIFMFAACIALGLILRHMDRENKRLLSVIEGMHKADLQRDKGMKQVDSGVLHEAHKELL